MLVIPFSMIQHDDDQNEFFAKHSLHDVRSKCIVQLQLCGRSAYTELGILLADMLHHQWPLS